MWYVGTELGDMPNAEQLQRLAAARSSAAAVQGPEGGEQITTGDKAAEKPGAVVPLGQGLPALPKKTVDRIRSYEYVDFTELPPAKGKMRAIPQSVEGQIIVVQAEDLMQSKKLIPDLPTWLQCFALYVTVAAKHQPERIPDLMAYMNSIAKASKIYKWPAWVVYDQNFRQEVAGSREAVWARVDPSIYSQCFLGMARNTEGWCQKCQSLDHASEDCPSARSLSRKRP